MLFVCLVRFFFVLIYQLLFRCVTVFYLSTITKCSLKSPIQKRQERSKKPLVIDVQSWKIVRKLDLTHKMCIVTTGYCRICGRPNRRDLGCKEKCGVWLQESWGENSYCEKCYAKTKSLTAGPKRKKTNEASKEDVPSIVDEAYKADTPSIPDEESEPGPSSKPPHLPKDPFSCPRMPGSWPSP